MTNIWKVHDLPGLGGHLRGRQISSLDRMAQHQVTCHLYIIETLTFTFFLIPTCGHYSQDWNSFILGSLYN